MITYPLTPPASPKPSEVIWSEINAVAISESPFSLKQQILDWGGSRWSIEVLIDPLLREEAQPWIAFLSALRGPLGSFTFGDEHFKAPRGTGAGTPLVKGAGQVGFTLLTDGWANGQTVLKAGDFLQIGTALYRALQDVTSDGSGNATIEVFPRLKAHADNSPLVLSSPVGLFRLSTISTVTQRGLRSGAALFPIQFDAVEVVA